MRTCLEIVLWRDSNRCCQDICSISIHLQTPFKKRQWQVDPGETSRSANLLESAEVARRHRNTTRSSPGVFLSAKSWQMQTSKEQQGEPILHSSVHCLLGYIYPLSKHHVSTQASALPKYHMPLFQAASRKILHVCSQQNIFHMSASAKTSSRKTVSKKATHDTTESPKKPENSTSVLWIWHTWSLTQGLLSPCKWVNQRCYQSPPLLSGAWGSAWEWISHCVYLPQALNTYLWRTIFPCITTALTRNQHSHKYFLILGLLFIFLDLIFWKCKCHQVAHLADYHHNSTLPLFLLLFFFYKGSSRTILSEFTANWYRWDETSGMHKEEMEKTPWLLS